MGKLPWIPVEKAIKQFLEQGKQGYLSGYVAMYCHNHPDWEPTIKAAHLRFFGGDHNRPYWADGKEAAPIENSAWAVKFFCPSEYFIP